jgi:LuxR family maltose regulon positive regulatory protein
MERLFPPMGFDSDTTVPMILHLPDSDTVPALPPFAYTKLHIPRLRRRVLPRPRLVAQVRNAMTDTRVLLLSAPAGSGKTTLLATVLAEGTPEQAAWIALDGNDNDLVQFLTLLIAAIEQLFGFTAASARTLLENGSGGERSTWGRHIVTALINDIVAADAPPLPSSALPRVLVLDDLHLLHDPIIYALLEYAIERLPPSLVLMVATRHDPPLPLARLRARRDLVEIRLNELKFTFAEVEQLLNERLDLNVSAEVLAQLYERTEGWAAGLSLLAISLEQLGEGTERGQFLDHLEHTERFLFDYLAEEVLNLQEPATRTFLLESSILKELTPSLTHAVTGDPTSATRLESLYRHNLFLTMLEQREGEPVYRYHDLFAEFLQTRLRQTVPFAAWRTLHRRAALVELHPTRRMYHLLQAEAWEEAAQFLLSIGAEYIAHSRGELLYQWISALPDSLVEQYPRLSLWAGQEVWNRMDVAAAHTFFERARATFAAQNDAVGEGEALAHLAITQSLDAPLERTEPTIHRALTLPLPPAQRVALLLTYALRFVFNARWREGLERVDEAIQLAQEEPTPAVLRNLALYCAAPFVVLSGGIERWARVLRLIERHGPVHHSQWRIDHLQIRTLYHTGIGAWKKAIEDCDTLYALVEPWGISPWRLINIAAIPIRVPAIQSRLLFPPDEGFNRILALEQETVDSFSKGTAIFYLFHYAYSALELGRMEEITELYDRIRAFCFNHPQPDMALLERLLAGRIALYRHQEAEAERALTEAAAIQADYPYTILFADANLLLAALYLRQQHFQRALDHLAPRLAQYSADGATGFCMWQGRIIVPLLQFAIAQGVHTDIAETILQRWNEPLVATPPDTEKGGLFVPHTGQYLSLREVEVLTWVARGANAGAIAEHLIISPHTVRQHIKNLYNKLGVSSRAEATRYAVELGVV